MILQQQSIMGLGNFRIRLFLAFVCIIFLLQSFKLWFNFVQNPVITKDSSTSQINTSREIEKINVGVYYEALCPDSRGFFIYQLLPTFNKLGEHLNIEFIPYGKATTIPVKDTFEFTCQHGIAECQANTIHACSINFIKNPSVLINYLTCMIKHNLFPIEIMNSCAERYRIDRDSIYNCYQDKQGQLLLAKYGEMTNSLQSSIDFIPKISLNGRLDNQVEILKNFLPQVCLYFKVQPEGCLT